MRTPLDIAKSMMLASIRRLELDASCAFCDCGSPDDDADGDGSDRPHDDECPLFGFELTQDIERLKTWATKP